MVTTETLCRKSKCQYASGNFEGPRVSRNLNLVKMFQGSSRLRINKQICLSRESGCFSLKPVNMAIIGY